MKKILTLLVLSILLNTIVAHKACSGWVFKEDIEGQRIKIKHECTNCSVESEIYFNSALGLYAVYLCKGPVNINSNNDHDIKRYQKKNIKTSVDYSAVKRMAEILCGECRHGEEEFSRL